MFKKVLGKILTILLAFLLFVSSFLLEMRFAGFAQIIQQNEVMVSAGPEQPIQFIHEGKSREVSDGRGFEIVSGDSIDSLSNQKTEIHFGEEGILRLAPQTSIEFSFSDKENKGFVFRLLKGRVWGNALFSTGTLSVLAGGAYLVPKSAIFDLQFDGIKAQIYAAKHNFKVALVSPDFSIEGVSASIPSQAINSFLLTQGNESTLFNDKILSNKETLKKLFYSKLIKEVQYGFIDPSQLKNDPWFQQNFQADDDFSQKTSTDDLRAIRDRGLKISGLNSVGYQAMQAADRVARTLTFSSDKSTAYVLDGIFDHLLDSEYLLIFGRVSEAQQRLDYFQQLTLENFQGGGQNFRENYLKRLRYEYAKLGFVSSLDPLGLAKNVLRDLLLSKLGQNDDELREKFLLVRQDLNDVYDVVGNNVPMARLGLETYYQHFINLLPQGENHSELMRDVLTADNQIMDNLFRQYAAFYKDSYFAMKNRLEQERLKIIPDGDEKNEEKQTIISNKIDFLRQLKTFFLADQIGLEDARQIVFRLFREADALQLPSDIQLAIGELFAKRLDDFGVFYRYLNSPEYVGTTLHGKTHQEQFQQYLQAQQEQVSINQIRQEILGDQTKSAQTVESILADLQKDFATMKITDVRLGTFTGPSQKLIPIDAAKFNDSLFQAQYDWDQKLFYQVSVDGKVLSKDGLQLNNLGFLFQPKVTTQNTEGSASVEISSVPTPQPSYSKTELVARVLLLQKLRANDLVITQDQIRIVDLSKNQFEILQATFVSEPDLTVGFQLNSKTNLVSAVRILQKIGEQNISGEFTLENLAKQIKAQPLRVKRK